MVSKRSISVLIALIAISAYAPLLGFSNWVRNDPYPLYSSVYPYAFLATRQKAQLMRFNYAYPLSRFRFSLSGFQQWACRARNQEKQVIQLGDINGRFNMLGLFYDPASRARFNSIPVGSTGLADAIDALASGDENNQWCFNNITKPNYSDPNKEFGFFSVPLYYKKSGIRLETELLLVDRCFYAIGLKAQVGLADVRQTVCSFNDLTGQALGVAYPANSPAVGSEAQTATPAPVAQPGITPPFVSNEVVPGAPACGAITATQCPIEFQPFTPCANQTCCDSYDCDCKDFVRHNIMKQRNAIAEILKLDFCNYHEFGVEDLRLSMYWRQIFVINEESDIYPRLLFMPFAEVGVGVPLEKRVNTHKVFGVPASNNGHASVSAQAGFTLDFLDTIDLCFAGGFTHFFSQDYCDYSLPTNNKESGIYPYTADINLRPGTTWTGTIGMHAYQFLPNLSFWGEYEIIKHAPDKIHVCHSFIPADSIYSPDFSITTEATDTQPATRVYKPGDGFLVDLAECRSEWESQMVTAGFNYDLSPYLSAGFLLQIPVRQRNAYRATTALGTLTFVY